MSATNSVVQACRNPATCAARADGERFCPQHQAVLVQMRADLSGGWQSKRIHGSKGRPVCSIKGCYNDRANGHMYCLSCSAAVESDGGDL